MPCLLHSELQKPSLGPGGAAGRGRQVRGKGDSGAQAQQSRRCGSGRAGSAPQLTTDARPLAVHLVQRAALQVLRAELVAAVAVLRAAATVARGPQAVQREGGPAAQTREGARDGASARRALSGGERGQMSTATRRGTHTVLVLPLHVLSSQKVGPHCLQAAMGVRGSNGRARPPPPPPLAAGTGILSALASARYRPLTATASGSRSPRC